MLAAIDDVAEQALSTGAASTSISWPRPTPTRFEETAMTTSQMMPGVLPAAGASAAFVR